MTNILAPTAATILYVGGQVGSEGYVTGRVFAGALFVAATSYLICLGVDWISARKRQRGHQ